MDFTSFVKPELMILIPVLYIVGMGLKWSEFENRYIPLALGAFSIALCVIYMLSVTPIPLEGLMTALFTGITQGVLCAGASVYANQLWQQMKK